MKFDVSASAVSAIQAKAPKRAPDLTEEERVEVLVFPSGGYGSIPNFYWDELPRKCAGVEYQVIGQILRRTWGGDFSIRDSRGGYDSKRLKRAAEDDSANAKPGRKPAKRPAWTPLDAISTAKLLGVTADAVEQALREAEIHSYIESRTCGRFKWYRALPENFCKGEDREPRTVERKPAVRESEVHAVAPSEKLVLYPGAKSRPIRLADDMEARALGSWKARLPEEFRLPEARFDYKGSLPLKLLASEAGDGYVNYTIEEWAEGELPANDSLSRDRVSAFPKISKNGEHEAKHSLSPGRVSGKSSVHKKGLAGNAARENERSVVADADAEEIALMREFLIRWCQPKIGAPPTDDQVRGIIQKLNGAAREQLAQRIQKRSAKLEYLSWKMVEQLAGDVGREYASSKPQETELTPEQIAELDSHYRRHR